MPALMDEFFVPQQPTVTMTFLAQTGDATDLTTYTFAGQNLGTASGYRKIVVGVSSAMTTPGDPSSVTVAGISATKLVGVNGASSNCSLWIASVPTGTSGSIVVTNSNAALRCVIQTWQVERCQSTASSTQTSTAVAPTCSISCGDRSAIVGIAYSGDTTTCTWTGITEDSDAQTETQTFTSAHTNFATAQSSLTCTATFAITGSSVHLGCWAALQPGY